ncbi:MAG: hypothetical protein CME36_07005 [unclassified Hahellaceae]|nr:hypothetical protein [Hahellaceae bacterium]
MTTSGPARQRLAWKLTKTILVLSVALGMLLSVVQIALDYRQHSEALDQLFARIANTAVPPARRALQTLDPQLAEEVVEGLVLHDAVTAAYVTDEFGETLAAIEKPTKSSATSLLTGLLNEPQRQISAPLSAANLDDASVTGELRLEFDMNQAFLPFFARAGRMLGLGLIKGLVLGLILVYALRRLLTSPLHKMTRTIRTVDPDNISRAPVTVDPRHANDELGELADTFNAFAIRTRELLESHAIAERNVKESSSQLKLIMDTVPHMIFARAADDTILQCNRAFTEFYGNNMEALIGKRHSELQAPISETEAEQLKARYDHYRQKLKDARSENKRLPRQYEKMLLSNAIGDRRWIESMQLPMESLGRDCTLVIAHDVTDRIEAQDKIDQLAFEDLLTGMPNRRLTLDRLGFDITRSRNNAAYGAFMILDLDSFKTINDSFGHSAGDELLVQVSRHLRQILHEEVTIGRIGGDEFGILAPDLGKQPSDAATGAEFIAQTILRELKRAFSLQAGEFHINSSIGIALYPDADSTAESVLRSADTALFQAKQQGGSVYRMFTESMKLAVRQQLDLELDLRRALKDSEFCLHFQPLVRVTDNVIIGAECLLRWNHPNKGMVYPDVFITALEQSGFMLEAGDAVIDLAFGQLQQWQREGVWPQTARLSVNISPSQFFDASFVEKIIQRLRVYDVQPTSIELEITESTVMQDIRGTMQKIEALRSMGVRFALDDFGTGYSSLSYLKLLPVDVLKIDRSFVKDAIDATSNDAAILQTIIRLARHLKLEVVAEGVETQPHLDLLRDNGCDNYQGYLYSRPVGAQAFRELLLSRRDALTSV